MDIVYITTTSTNEELRFSIRSMVKHLDKIGNIFIIGHRPSFLNRNIIHIPADDRHKHNYARNIYEKILTACNDERVSDNFLYVSDDHFLRADYCTSCFPNYSNARFKTLQAHCQQLTSKNTYKPFCAATIKVLEEGGFPTINYNVHTPIIYNKEKFKFVTSLYDWETQFGYVAKSLYGNTLRLPIMETTDLKIYTPKSTEKAIYLLLGKHPFFSINEHAMNESMMNVLNELYNERSFVEK